MKLPSLQIYVKAISLALVAFAIIYFGVAAIARRQHVMSGDYVTIALFNLGALLSWIVSGYIAARMIRQKSLGAIISALTGLLATCLVGIEYFFSGHIHLFLSDWVSWVSTSIILGGIGGLVWTTQAFITGWARSYSNSRSRSS